MSTDSTAGTGPSVTPHAEPFHCPYCGLGELRPDEDHGTWFCEACTRVFSLRLLAVRS
jgi:ribosomal protein L37AE/L43A